ncbi:transposase [Micromonospora rhizosphaerae]|uniref:Transposase n=1 Tax=Micromonospora rhizosphaerae TaxID=568872 RepID=A0A1C6S9K6_9ACTN|nr:transposase [Micromonospora rhizosphaerae]SCL26074.1 transposase [Micromonospora rhizosphaerae]
MARSSKYSADFRVRAMRLVTEAGPEHDTEWAAITSVAHKLGVSSEMLRKWIRQAEVDAGQRPGPRRMSPQNSSGCGGKTPSCVGRTRS